VPLTSRKKDGYIQVLHEDQPVSVLGDRYIPDSPLFADCSSLFRVKKRNLSGFVKGMSDRFAARIMPHTAILCPEGPDWLKLQPGSLVESDGSLYLIMDDENGRQMVPDRTASLCRKEELLSPCLNFLILWQDIFSRLTFRQQETL